MTTSNDIITIYSNTSLNQQIPANTNISGQLVYTFTSDSQYTSGTLYVTVVDAEGGVKVGFNNQELYTLSYDDNKTFVYTVNLPYIQKGSNTIHIWSQTGDGQTLKQVQVKAGVKTKVFRKDNINKIIDKLQQLYNEYSSKTKEGIQGLPQLPSKVGKKNIAVKSKINEIKNVVTQNFGAITCHYDTQKYFNDELLNQLYDKIANYLPNQQCYICDQHSPCSCNNTCNGYNCTCNSSQYGHKTCTCNSKCHGYRSCTCDLQSYYSTCSCYNKEYVTCGCYFVQYNFERWCMCNRSCHIHSTCTCNNRCDGYTCVCESTCYEYSCTCHNVYYNYTPCSCNNRCYGYTTCTCDNTCYGYFPCSCYNRCHSFSCSCNNKCYSDSCTCDYGCHPDVCTCYNQCHGEGTPCTCNNRCYGYLPCSCYNRCYSDSCSCNNKCYYDSCTCDYGCHPDVCACYNQCHEESTPCTCNNRCYGHSCTCYGICYKHFTCYCDNRCYTYNSCTCYNTCVGFTCLCEGTYSETTCTCYDVNHWQAYDFRTSCYKFSCQCNNMCYRDSPCSCNNKCYGHSPCSCDMTCYGYTCTCNNTNYGEKCANCYSQNYSCSQFNFSCLCDVECDQYDFCPTHNTCNNYSPCNCYSVCVNDTNVNSCQTVSCQCDSVSVTTCPTHGSCQTNVSTVCSSDDTGPTVCESYTENINCPSDNWSCGCNTQSDIDCNCYTQCDSYSQ